MRQDFDPSSRLGASHHRPSSADFTTNTGGFEFSVQTGDDRCRHGWRHAEVFLEVLSGKGFAKPNPRPMFPNPSSLLRLEPFSEGLRDCIWWGAGTNAMAKWAAKLGITRE
jgi:alkanesulfonate monooxygenase SsuD/methylene tetrahydromethanopterin reductase-like flavin-dependent oxidoreductase (luciferase family)